MPQPEAPAARSGANQGAAYSESASNGASMPAPARSLYPKLAFFISLLDVWRLAEHLDIPVIPLSGFHEAALHAERLFLNGGQAMFSGVTVFRGSNRTIVFNDAQVVGRQASDIGHELSHGLLLHTPVAAVDGRGCRVWDRDVEAEANWLSGALLVPEEAALQIVQRGLSMPQAAAKYGVTPKMVQYRISVTGARTRV